MAAVYAANYLELYILDDFKGGCVKLAQSNLLKSYLKLVLQPASQFLITLQTFKIAK